MELNEIISKSKKLRRLLDLEIDMIIKQDDLSTHISSTWIVKDLLAHIFWHEREMQNMLATMSLVGSEYWLLSLKERNEKIFQEFNDKKETQIQLEYTQSFIDMIVELKKTPEEAMTDSKFFDNMPIEWKPWQVIAGNTFDHYKDHITQLRNGFEYL